MAWALLTSVAVAAAMFAVVHNRRRLGRTSTGEKSVDSRRQPFPTVHVSTSVRRVVTHGTQRTPEGAVDTGNGA